MPDNDTPIIFHRFTELEQVGTTRAEAPEFYRVCDAAYDGTHAIVHGPACQTIVVSVGMDGHDYEVNVNTDEHGNPSNSPVILTDVSDRDNPVSYLVKYEYVDGTHDYRNTVMRLDVVTGNEDLHTPDGAPLMYLDELDYADPDDIADADRPERTVTPYETD